MRRICDDHIDEEARPLNHASAKPRHNRTLRFALGVVVLLALLSLATYIGTTDSMTEDGSSSSSGSAITAHIDTTALTATTTALHTEETSDSVVLTPLPPSSSSHIDDNNTHKKRFAYMFYLTTDIYACAALHFIRTLVHTTKMDTSRIDLAVLHSPDVSHAALTRLQSYASVPIRLIPVDTINADSSETTWLASLTKLHAFREWGYDRVVYIDADSVPLQKLDHLFDLPSAPLYAPRAYWLPQPFFASTLMVIEPSNPRFTQMIQWAKDHGAAAGFDMDILNAFFKSTVTMLPGDYTVLNSDFRKRPEEETKLYRTVTELKVHTKLVHFSCTPDGRYGKPWTPENLSSMEEEGFDPLFAQLFQDFWKTQQNLCDR